MNTSSRRREAGTGLRAGAGTRIQVAFNINVRTVVPPPHWLLLTFSSSSPALETGSRYAALAGLELTT